VGTISGLLIGVSTPILEDTGGGSADYLWWGNVKKEKKKRINEKEKGRQMNNKDGRCGSLKVQIYGL
jgi:hypothetical protein